MNGRIPQKKLIKSSYADPDQYDMLLSCSDSMELVNSVIRSSKKKSRMMSRKRTNFINNEDLRDGM